MSAPNTATVLVSCPDRPGLVAALAQVLYGHGANVLAADQHTDSEAGPLFQHIRLSRAVRAHLEDRILVFENKTVVFD